MEQAIYNFLTDETARNLEAVAVSLEAQTQGAPWFDAMNEAALPQNS